MFGSLRKKKNKNAVEHVSNNNNDSTQIKLALNETDNVVMSDLQKQYLKSELDELRSMNKDSVDISPVYFNYSNNCLEVKVFIRNSFSRAINFDKISFRVDDKEGNLVAKKVFDLKNLGNVEPNTAKPYKLFFTDEDIVKKDFDCENLIIGFDKDVNCFQNVDVKIGNLPKELSFAEQDKYNEFLSKLPRLQKDTITISAVDLIKYEDGGMAIIIVIRNGYSRGIAVQNVPITILDKNNEVVASCKFKNTTFNVKASSASMYRFVISENDIVNKDCDLSSWHVVFNGETK